MMLLSAAKGDSLISLSLWRKENTSEFRQEVRAGVNKSEGNDVWYWKGAIL